MKALLFFIMIQPIFAGEHEGKLKDAEEKAASPCQVFQDRWKGYGKYTVAHTFGDDVLEITLQNDTLVINGDYGPNQHISVSGRGGNPPFEMQNKAKGQTLYNCSRQTLAKHYAHNMFQSEGVTLGKGKMDGILDGMRLPSEFGGLVDKLDQAYHSSDHGADAKEILVCAAYRLKAFVEQCEHLDETSNL